MDYPYFNARRWPRLLTDWCVFHAFEKAGTPAVLSHNPAHAVVLVDSVSECVCQWLDFAQQEELDDILAEAERDAYCAHGGDSHAVAEKRYQDSVRAANLSSWECVTLQAEQRLARANDVIASHDARSSPRTSENPMAEGDHLAAPDSRADADAELAKAREEARVCQDLIDRARRDSRSSASEREALILLRTHLGSHIGHEAREKASRAFWANRDPLTEKAFLTAPSGSIGSRVSQSDPGWFWREFVPKVLSQVNRNNPGSWHLLDALPNLRALHASDPSHRLVFSALVEEWCVRFKDVHGISLPVRYTNLEGRARKKASEVTAWFDERSPGYLDERLVRAEVHRELMETLEKLNPLRGTEGRQPLGFPGPN